MSQKALIVFDMDGVLVDVSGSYRETVRQTARLFLTGGIGYDTLPDPLFSLADLAAVKQSGGLNNDWDLTAAVLGLLFSYIDMPPWAGTADAWHTHGAVLKKCDLTGLSRALRASETPLSELLNRRGRTESPFVAGMYRGDVGSGNIIKQIFQEIYLGGALFARTYGIAAKMVAGPGLIDQESLLVEPAMLAMLNRDHALAIATGRPRAEADYPLDRFGIRSHFSELYTLDDCLAEEAKIAGETGRAVSLSKPHPFMLDAIARKQPAAAPRFYVGDMPDDMVAAQRSAHGFAGIGILVSTPDRDRLRAHLLAAGAHHVVDDFNGLLAVLGSG